MAWDDDSWRDSYDSWKLRSPYDDCEDAPECEHEEYHVDFLEGRATCDYCDYSWMMTDEDLKARGEAELRYDREMRRYHSWYMRLWRWIVAQLPKKRDPDDIPF